ncbi:MAG: DegV family protein [Thermaceae bacterium]|nr:DegV family protein [Thermaceae bacterium]
MSPRTAFVADSTLGLSPQQALERDIHTVPQQVVVGKGYRDYLEMSPEALALAQKAGQKVSTSQVNPSDLEALYEKLLHSYERIVSVHVSGKLSGTVQTAERIARQFGDKIRVLDSKSLNGGLQFVLDEARARLAGGVAWEQLEAAIVPLRQQVRGYVLPATLDYLRRGGRISGLQHFFGSLLKLLPILEIKDGGVTPVERVRGWNSGLRAMTERFHQQFPAGARVYLAHAHDLVALKELEAHMKKEAVVLEGIRQAGAAVMAHTGPGTVAVFAAPLK